jgi:hypothetical protein
VVTGGGPTEHGRPWWHYFRPWNPHCFTGYLVPLLVKFVSPALGAMVWGSFLFYELVEWLYFWWIDKAPDKIYVDTLEMTAPLVLSSSALLALGCLGLLG